MSRKQLLNAAAKGQPVKLIFPDGSNFVGFIAGMDDYHVHLVRPVFTPSLEYQGVESGLFHKAHAKAIMFLPEKNISREKQEVKDFCESFCNYSIKEIGN
jgi:hypothetical protein